MIVLFFHHYHLFFLLTMPRRTMAIRSIPSTRAIRTSAVPYCRGLVCFDMGPRRGQDVDVIGKGHHLVEDRFRQDRGEKGRRREHDGRRLAGGAADPQDRPGQDAGQGRGEDDPGDGAPFGDAQGQGGLAEGLGHRLEGLLRGPDDRGQDQDAERQRAGEDAGTELQKDDEEAEAEETEDDGGDAGQAVHADADDPDEEPLPGVLRQIDRRDHPQGQGDRRSPRRSDRRCRRWPA